MKYQRNFVLTVGLCLGLSSHGHGSDNGVISPLSQALHQLPSEMWKTEIIPKLPGKALVKLWNLPIENGMGAYLSSVDRNDIRRTLTSKKIFKPINLESLERLAENPEF